MTEPARSITELLTQAEWVENLARCLTRDDALAEDAVQETWLYALRRRPGHSSSARSWLARVVRNAILQRRRSDDRRAQRESLAAKPESLPPSSEVVEKTESMRLVVDAVLALSEPTRTMILLRFYEGLSARAIARRLGLSVETVRTRLKRGIAQLREELTRRHGSDSWRAALVPLLATGPAGVPIGVGIGIAAVLLAMLLAWSYMSAEPETKSEPASTAPVVSSKTEEEPDPEPPGVARVPSELAVNDAPPVQSPLVRQSEIRARLIYPDDTAAEGIEMDLSGFIPRSNSPLPERWRGGRARSDATGSISWTCEPPPDCQLYLQTLGVDISPIEVRPKGALSPGEIRDLGDIMIEVAGILEGSLLGDRGNMLPDVWWVGVMHQEAQNPESPIQRDNISSKTFPGFEPEFRFTRLRPGRWRISYGPEGGPDDMRRHRLIDVHSGRTTRVELEYPEAAFDGTIIVRAGCAKTKFPPELERVRLIGPDGVSHASSGRRWISGYFDFTDLLPGEYRLEIDDPRFYPWTMEAIRPGSDTIEAELRGTSTIELEVFDGDSGSPCIRFAVDSTMVTYRRASRGSTIHLDDMSDHEEGRCVLSAMPAGTHVLEIWTPSREKQKATVHDVQPGEHRAHRVVFGGLTTVSGQVVRAGNNTPVPGIAVGLFEPVTRPVSPEKDLARVQTDAEGSFRFENVAPGRYILRVVDGPQRELGPLAKYGVVATIDPLVVEPGRPSVENRLVLPAHGSLRIDLRTPENASFENVKVRLRRPGPVSGLDPELLVPLGAQGPVELAPLDPGTYLLELRVEQVMLLGVGPMRTSSGQTLSLGEILIEGGRTTEETRDLRDQWPGSFRVRVSGHTWEPLRVYVRVFVPGSPSQRESFLAWVEEDGTATFPAIFEGTKQIVVHDWKDSWGYLADDPVEVRSGEATTCTVAVPFYEGTLECRGGEPEAPLARIQVQLALDDSSNRLQSPMRPGLRILTADATGTIRLRLPPATYTLTSDHGTARFEWTANGATPSIARFTRER